MTTTLQNVDFAIEVRSFMDSNTPVSTAAILCALHDALKARGRAYLCTDEAKALLHSINIAIHGVGYRLDGSKEHARLRKVFHTS